MKRILISVVLLSLVHTGTVLAIPSSWFFSVQEGGFRCVDIILPDDSGYTGFGTFEYTITCSPFVECYYWGSTVTEERVAASENNTGIIPVCFIVPGDIPVGNCSRPMVLKVDSVELGVSESREGGICVSRYEDFESASRVEGQSVEDVLSDNFDLFDIGFSQPRVFAKSGENFTYRLLVESYADVILDLDVEDTGIEVSPSRTTVSLSGESPENHLDFSVDGISRKGNYYLKVSARAGGCSEPYCIKQARGMIIVSDDPDQTSGEGFSLSLFPNNINVKDLSPVAFRLNMKNFGERSLFYPEISINPNASNTFSNEGIDIDGGEEITKNFIIRPENSNALYEVTVSVRLDGNTKRVTSYLSTNEMLTDIIREKDNIRNAESLSGVSDDLDSWYQDYKDSDYGKNLQEYSTLKDALSEAGETPEPLPPGPEPPEEPDGPGATQDYTLPALGGLIGIFLIILFIWTRKRKPEKERDIFERY